jgi:hypothetical protein
MRTLCSVVALLTLVATAWPQDDTTWPVVVRVIQDGSPCHWAQITIRPVGAANGWPRGKTEIKLTADDEGRAKVKLGAGTYQVIAQDSIMNKEPESARIKVPGSGKVLSIRLVLRYWNCGVVTCEL